MKSFIAVLSLAVALPAAPAEASSCVIGPYALTADPPTNCALEYWRHAWSGEPGPRAYVIRNGVQVDVTDASTHAGETVLDYTYYTLDCHDEIIEQIPQSVTMDVFRVTFANAEIGEQIYIDAIPVGTVQPAAIECPLPAYPAPSCAGTYHESTCEPGGDEDPWGEGADDTVGCNATGGASSGVLVGLALLAFARRRRSA
jgi:uncharacterized protein (TIGR03382 family)